MQLPNNTGAAVQALKDRIKEKLESTGGAGKVYKRIRYAEDLAQWMQLAAVNASPGVDVLRCAFIYFVGWETAPAECKSTLLSPVFGIEIIQQYIDGTDEANSTLDYENFLCALIDSFKSDLNLGFTEGKDLSHEGLQGPEGAGEGRPEYVDGVLSHRKIITLTVHFRI